MSTTQSDSVIRCVEKTSDQINTFQREGKRMFLSSSLQTHSLPLLHIIHQIDAQIPVYFLDTGYHFPETIRFKEQLKKEFGFNIQELRSPVDKINQRDANGRLMYASEPDYCCYLNKVLPLEPVLKSHDVWISGVRAGQNAFRADLKTIEKGKHDTLRYHPMLCWTSKMIFEYRKMHDLPEHPLEAEGYFSIGCMPCTRKMDLDSDPREMRWFGLNKTECGLQTETLEQK
jgi:phosphoadenosine phosphosulfate reductase